MLECVKCDYGRVPLRSATFFFLFLSFAISRLTCRSLSPASLIPRGVCSGVDRDIIDGDVDVENSLISFCLGVGNCSTNARLCQISLVAVSNLILQRTDVFFFNPCGVTAVIFSK